MLCFMSLCFAIFFILLAFKYGFLNIKIYSYMIYLQSYKYFISKLSLFKKNENSFAGFPNLFWPD